MAFLMSPTRIFEFTGRAIPAGSREGLGWVSRVVILAVVLGALPACEYSAEARDRLTHASVATTFDLQGKVRFCYDRDPAVVYFQYDKETNKTYVKSRWIDDHELTVFQFDGTADERSLSCSLDGSKIVALDGEQQKLFIWQAESVSVYRFDKPLLYSVLGKYSLLSSDGSTIALPSVPIHVSGPDFLAKMRSFAPDKSWSAFFEGGDAYVDEKRSIDVYRYESGWRKRESIAKSPGFSVKEIARCGGHVVASLSDDDSGSLKILDENSPESTDWLARVGIRSLLSKFRSTVAIDGGYGQCVLPLIRKHDVREILEELVAIDGDRIRRYKIAGARLGFSDDEVRLSKDGCYALFRTFKRVPEIPQFTMPQQAVVLRLDAPDCGQ